MYLSRMDISNAQIGHRQQLLHQTGAVMTVYYRGMASYLHVEDAVYHDSC